MFDASNRQSAKRDSSLLSLGATASAPERPGQPASLLKMAGGGVDDDPALRHRLARSRREAAPSPLIEALAHGGSHAAPPSAEAPALNAERQQGGGSPSNTIAGWVKGLFGRGDAPASHTPASGEPVAAVARPAASYYEPRPEPAARVEPAPRPAPVAESARTQNPEFEQTLRDDAETAADRRESRDRREQRAADRAADASAARRQDYWQPLIDPFKVIGGITKSRWIIVATTIVGAVLGVMVAMSTPKQYQAYTELLVDPRDLKLTESELTTTGLPSDATLALVENQARVLTSSIVLNKVVDKLNLTEDPEFNGQAKGALGLSTVISLIRSLLSGTDATVDEGRKRALAVEHLGQSITVERGGKTFIIVISVQTRDPEKSALIANTMSQVFLQTSGELQSDTAGRATEELTARLEELRNGLGEAERKVAAFKAAKDIVDPQGRLITDDEIVKVNDQLSVAKARTIELNARAATIKSMTASAAVAGTLPEELTSPVITELRAQYAALKLEADRLSARLGPRHPTRMAAEAQVAGSLDRIAIELRRISSSLQVELARAVEQEQSLAARLAQLKVRQGGIGDDLVTLRELEREATAKRAVYEAFLLRARETAERQGINATNLTVISPAYPPLDPTGPGRSTIAAGGAILGLLFGIGLGAARGGWESLRDSMASRPRRRRWNLAGRRPDDQPPQGNPPGNRAEPKETPEKGEGDRMGLFSRLRRAPEPAPSYGAPGGFYPGYPPAPPHPGYASAYAAAPAVPHYAAATAMPGYGPAYSGPPAHHTSYPQPALGYGWPQPAPASPYGPNGQPVWAQPPQHFAAAPAMHPGYAQPVPPQQAFAGHYPPAQPAPAQSWQPAGPAWPPAPPATPVVYATHFHPPAEPVYRETAEARHRPATEPQYRSAMEPQRPAAEQSAMEEIRDSLREFREAVQGLTEQRRRYS